MKFRKGDEVMITAGKDKGKKGKIEKILSKQDRVVLPGLNIYKRHLKKKDEKNPGGIVEFSRPVPLGNIAFLCSKCGKVTRLGFKLSKGSKSRVCRKCGAII